MFWHKWFIPKPFNSGFLAEKDGHRVAFAEFGNPKGIPVLFFNGGPGGKYKPERAKIANLRKYRVIMFDQRGCGRSLPLGKTEYNTTQDLLNDTTRLVKHLKIKQKIILRGASWGSTLALLWAEQNPDKVSKILLSQVFLANNEFRNWEFNGTQLIYPEFVDALNKESKGKINTYYNKLIQSVNTKNQLHAINRLGWFERICGSMTPKFSELTEINDAELASHRIYMHYAANNLFLENNDILDNIHKIKNIETVIIHNRLDLVCPFKGAYDIHKLLPNSHLISVPEFGHVGKKLHNTIQNIFGDILK
ncbi:MAG: alpha/beta fold hydrolase [Alphaproteobacteria bacterium]|nr:alpha/beta fold hydrolase [Alphaproteobacteria bacterium]